MVVLPTFKLIECRPLTALALAVSLALGGAPARTHAAAYSLRIGGPTPGSVTMAADYGAYTLTGQNVTFTYNPAGAGTSVTYGVQNIDTGLGGSARLYFRWGRPTTNTNASFLKDLKSFKLYIGTSSGATDILNGFDFVAEGAAQKALLECRILGLTAATTYYVKVEAYNYKNVVSAKSTEYSAAAYVYTPAGHSFTDVNATTTISVSGSYQLGSNFTGTITINANNVYLYGNGKTLTFNNAANGIVLGSGITGLEIDSVTFSHTGTGAARNIACFGTTVGTGALIHGCVFDIDGDTVSGIRNVAGDTVNLNNARIFDNTFNLDTHAVDGLTSVGGMMYCDHFYFYGNTINSTNVGRDGAMVSCHNYEDWSNTLNLYSLNGGVYSTTFGTSGTVWSHDNTINVLSVADHWRLFHWDNDDDVFVNWNVININCAAPADVCQVVSFRGSSTNVHANYNKVYLNNLSIAYVFRAGGDEQGSVPVDITYIGNETFDDPGNSLGQYQTWTGTLTTFGNIWQRQIQSATPCGGNWNSNEDSWAASGTVVIYNGSTSGTWTSYQSYSSGQVDGSTSNITFAGSWQGYNPNTLTPTAPGTITSVGTGVP